MIDKNNRKKNIEEFSPITVGEVLASFEDFKINITVSFLKDDESSADVKFGFEYVEVN